MNKRLGLLCALFALFTAATFADVSNQTELRKALGLDRWTNVSPKNVRVVVIDKGFGNFVDGDERLPKNTELYRKFGDFPEAFRKLPDLYAQDADEPSTNHGLKIAEIVWSLSGKSVEGPEFRLIQAESLSELTRAVQFADWWDASIVVYAQVSLLGNGDGTGPINQAILPYVSNSKRLWINSAGNYGTKTYVGKVRSQAGEVRFFNGSQKGLRFFCRADTRLQVDLLWKRFPLMRGKGTDRDLDLVVIDEKGRVVTETVLVEKNKPQVLEARSQRRQVVGKPANDKETQVPRESVEMLFKKNQKGGYYEIRVLDHSKNFDPEDDELRVVLLNRGELDQIKHPKTGELEDTVEFVDYTLFGSVASPADDKKVITVGTVLPYTSRGTSGSVVAKPDVFLPDTTVEFTDGKPFGGTSAAAAAFGAIAVTLKAGFPDLTRPQLLTYLRKLELPLPRLGLKVHSIQDSNWDERRVFDQRYPGVFTSLTQRFQAVPVLVARYEDVLHAFAFKMDRTQWAKEFSVDKESIRDFRYFVRLKEQANTDRRRLPTWKFDLHVIRRFSSEYGRRDLLPWDSRQGLDAAATEFIELGVTRTEQEIAQDKAEWTKEIGRMWAMPTVSDFRKIANP